MTKLTKMVYLLSPFSHPKKGIRDHRRLQIEMIGAELQAKYGYAFIHPITTSARLCEKRPDLLKGGEFKHWAAVDLTFISRCDEAWIICMKGWEESIGVQAEIKFAETINDDHYNDALLINKAPLEKIKLRYVHPETLKFISEKQARNLYKRNLFCELHDGISEMIKTIKPSGEC